MKELHKEYSAEFGHPEKEAWYHLMTRFQDANLYQAWAYDMVRFGDRRVAHMILRKRDVVVAAAQARIVRLPGVRTGIAYVLWGPIWRRKEMPGDPEIFRQTIRALRNEFSVRRGLVLRLHPLAFRGQDDVLKQILNDEGYGFHDDGRNHRTLIIELTPSLPEIRASLDQKWRNCLNRAEKNSLEIIEGEEESLFDEIRKIYLEMASRKGLVDLSDIEHLKKVQKDLPPGFKLKVVLCRLNGETCAGAIFSAIGATAVYHVGATSNAGMKSNGSYIIQWAFIKWLKENGFLYYDLNGINPETNPGTSHFKRGLGGKKGREVEFLGKFQVSDSRVSSWFVKGGEFALSGYRQILRKRRSLGNV
jgi:hypothetical protein